MFKTLTTLFNLLQAWEKPTPGTEQPRHNGPAKRMSVFSPENYIR